MRDEQDKGSFRRKGSSSAFTLIEMLVATAVLVIILGIVFEVTNQISKVWRSSTSRIQTFQEARAGFEAMTRRMGQATLNTYYDYYDSTYNIRNSTNTSSFVPATYDRVSDLHFISGQAQTLLPSTTGITTQTHAVFFQAPLGYSVTYPRVSNALNACGYFLRFDDAASSIPSYVKNAPSYKPRYRYRLMEMLQPTENLGVYFGGVNDWFQNNASANSRILAENVIALVILPKLTPTQDTTGSALAPTYNYDSRIPLKAATDPYWVGANPAFPPDAFTATSTGTRHHQLPPILHVIMVVIDEPSAIRLQGSATTVPTAISFPSPLFTDSTAAKLAADLQTVQNTCTAQHLNYRIFEGDVMMRDAQWSNN